MDSEKIVLEYQRPIKLRASIGTRIIRTGLAILFMLLILGWLAMPRYCSGCGRAKISATKATISNVKAALEQFKLEFGRYPTSAEGLDALVHEPAGIAEWQALLERQPVDGWGRAFVYRCPGIKEPAGFDLHSVGADGKDGTGDDISKDDI